MRGRSNLPAGFSRLEFCRLESRGSREKGFDSAYSLPIMRVVIKVGTSLIAPGGQIDINLLRGMVDQFDLSKNEYLIVTSGAIAAGMSGLSLEKPPGDVPQMQACAAVGQSKLMHTYERLFFGKKDSRAAAALERRLHFPRALPQFAERAR